MERFFRIIYRATAAKTFSMLFCGCLLLAAGQADAVGWVKNLGPQGGDSSPMYVDLDNNLTTEVLVTSGTYIYAYNGATGATMPGYPIDLGAVSTVMTNLFEEEENLTGRKQLMDVDGDGSKDLIVITVDGGGLGTIKTFNPLTGGPGWTGPAGLDFGTIMTGLAANIDGDSSYELVLATGAEIVPDLYYQNRAITWYHLGGPSHNTVQRTISLGSGPGLELYALGGSTLAVVDGGTVTLYNGDTGAVLRTLAPSPEWGAAALVRPFSKKGDDSEALPVLDMDGDLQGDFAVKFSSSIPNGSSYTYKTAIYVYNAATYDYEWNTATMTALTASVSREKDVSSLPIMAFTAPLLTGAAKYGFLISSFTQTGQQQYQGNTTFSVIRGQDQQEAWRRTYDNYISFDVVDQDNNGSSEVVVYLNNKAYFLNGSNGTDLWNMDPGINGANPLSIVKLAGLVRADQARWIPGNIDNAGADEIAVLVSSGNYGRNREHFIFQYDYVTYAELGRTALGVIGSSGTLNDDFETGATDTNNDSLSELAVLVWEDRNGDDYTNLKLMLFNPFIPQNFSCLPVSTSAIGYTWSDLGSEATGYHLIAHPGTILQSLGTGVTQWEETGLGTPGYTRYLRALTTFGYGEAPGITCRTLPLAATGFMGVPQSPTAITWQWSNNAAFAMNYKIFTSTGYQLVQLASNAVEWAETGLLPNTPYSRYAQVYNGVGSSDSAPGTAYTNAAGPTGLILTALSTTTLRADWGVNGNSTGTFYNLSISSDSGFGVAYTTASWTGSTNTWQMGGLEGGTTYYVIVRALNLGDGGYSNYTSTAVKVMPAQPSVPAFGAAAISSVTIQWGWTASTFADGYKLYSSTGALLSTGTALSAPETGLTPNTQYTRYVQAFNDLFFTNSASSAVYTNAAAPVSLSLTALSSTTLRADWGVNGNSTSTVYNLSISSDSGFGVAFTTASWTGSTNTWQMSGLEGGATYYVKVRAQNLGDSLYSAETAASRLMPAQPSAPGSFGAAAISSVTIQWGWTASTFVDGYRLYTAADAFLSSAAALSVSETGLTPNTPYTRYAQAYNAAYYNSSLSSAVFTNAAAPVSLSLAALSSTTLRADWGMNGNSTSTVYNLSVSSDSGFAAAFTTATWTGSTNTWQLGGLEGGATYYVKVRAQNLGDSLYSAYAQSANKLMPAQPSVPGSFQAAVITSSTIQWSWTASTFAEGYRLYTAADAFLSSAAAPSVAEAGLAPNTQYTRYVQAYNAAYYNSSLSSAVYTYAAEPGTPALTPASRSSLSVSWAANSNPAGTGYQVQYSTDANFAPGVSTVAVLTSTFTQFTGLTTAATYYVRVKAVNAVSVATAYSSTASAVIWSLPAITGVSPSSGTVISTGVLVAATGTDFHTGDIAYLLRGGTTVQASATVVAGLTSFTAQFSLIGLSTGTWDVIIKDSDGNASAATAQTDFNVLPESGVAASTVSAAAITITSANNAVSMDIPANTLAGGVVYISTDPVETPIVEDPAKIAQANANVTAGQALVPGVAVELVAYDSLGAQVTIPANPVRIYITYPDVNDDGIVDGTILREGNLFIVWMNPASSLWEAIPGSVLDAANHRIYVDSSHLSVFTLAGITTMANLSTAKVYPNPWKPGSGGTHDRATIKFDNLADNTSIRIYNAAGELVRDLAKSSLGYIEWDGKASGGSKVSSGVYFAYIKAGTDTKIRKFAIER